MKKLIVTLLAVTTTFVMYSYPTHASSGRLRGASITECGGAYYGQHGKDNHWHKAQKVNGSWYPDGGIVTGPCGEVVPSENTGGSTQKPAPKPEPKPESKPAPKPAPKPEPKPEPKPTPKPAPKPEAKPEAKPAPKPAPKPASKPESNKTKESVTAPKVETNKEAKPKVDVKESKKEEKVNLEIKQITINDKVFAITDDIDTLNYPSKDSNYILVELHDNEAEAKYTKEFDSENKLDELVIKVIKGKNEKTHKFNLVEDSQLGSMFEIFVGLAITTLTLVVFVKLFSTGVKRFANYRKQKRIRTNFKSSDTFSSKHNS